MSLSATESGPLTIQPDGSVPETRMKNAQAVQDKVRELAQGDEKRSKKRAALNGLVGGNPPFRQSKLRDQGRADATNANFGTARSYLESASGALYDLFSEAPGLVGVKSGYGTDEERTEESAIMSEEVDRVLQTDPLFDFEILCSQWQTTLHGCGPLFFTDPMRVLPQSAACGDLKVDEMTKADADYYDLASVDVNLYPPQVYEFIRNEQAAGKMGWNVAYTKKAIQNAMDLKTEDGQRPSWEYHAQQLKNNSADYLSNTKVCKLAYVWWREFDGRVTQAIIEREATSGQTPEYLYLRVGLYANFKQALHPMYLDRGNGGFHHSVNGLGVPMFSALTIENRLLCNMYDKVFAPKLLFRPTTAEGAQRFELAQHGDWGLLPSGYDVQQTPLQGLVNEGLAMFRAGSELMRSNLSSYRQPVRADLPGNPDTATETQYKATQQSALGKTTYARYYRQLDFLYTEIVRRLCNLNSTDERAQMFQARCIARGVRRECFGRIDRVEARRVIGQGNAFLRQQAVSAIAPIAATLPEEGRINWVDDYISANAGQSAISRWNPRKSSSRLASDQKANAALQVAALKIGVPPVITSTQNPLVYAGTFMQAATQAIQSLSQGASETEVLAFLEQVGPAALAHINRAINDPFRQSLAKELLEQWQDLARFTDKLREKLMSAAQEQQALAAKMNKTISDVDVKRMKVSGDLALKEQKQNAALEMQRQKHEQQMAIADAQSASGIVRETRRSEADLQRAADEAKAERERERETAGAGA